VLAVGVCGSEGVALPHARGLPTTLSATAAVTAAACRLAASSRACCLFSACTQDGYSYVLSQGMSSHMTHVSKMGMQASQLMIAGLPPHTSKNACRHLVNAIPIREGKVRWLQFRQDECAELSKTVCSRGNLSDMVHCNLEQSGASAPGKTAAGGRCSEGIAPLLPSSPCPSCSRCAKRSD